MFNDKAAGPDGLPIKILELGLDREAPEILYHFNSNVAAV